MFAFQSVIFFQSTFSDLSEYKSEHIFTQVNMKGKT